MEGLIDYSSSDDEVNKKKITKENSNENEEESEVQRPTKVIKYTVETAPDVEIKNTIDYKKLVVDDPLSKKKIGGKAHEKMMLVNIPYQEYHEEFEKQLILPLHPSDKAEMLMKNGVYGQLDRENISDHTFNTMNHTFNTYGYVKDPSINTVSKRGDLGAGIDGTGYVGDIEKALERDGLDISQTLSKKQRDKIMPKPKRKPKGDVSVLEGEDAYLGPWAKYEGERDGEPAGPTQEELEAAGIVEEFNKPITEVEEKEISYDSTVFHGKSERDYLGRTYMHVPQDLDINLNAEPGSVQNFLPKKLEHTWDGHTKGVSSIRFFPNSGHLLLSSGMDAKVKLWDVYHDRELLRSYIGHTKGIREVNFNNDGTRFITASYDKSMKIWDTETGKCIATYSTGKIPYTAKFHPDPHRQNIFLAGCADKKIVQFDSNTGKIIQEYDQHLGAVNSITFVDDNKRFVSTSDDKTLRVWENDIPVVVKYVAEPHMHSMPSVTIHPSLKYIACQSLDNQILIYGAKGRFSQNNRKRFTGHIVAGYACQPSFSPDGRFLTSGDADGSLWFWDWKTTKVLKKMKCHKAVLIGCQWHPKETSKVATCSWDGLIKYWD